MRRMFLLLGLLLGQLLSARADTTWVGEGFVGGEWTAEGSPYLVIGTLTVPHWDSLRIGPGVEVLFAGPYQLVSGGVLRVEGTAEDSVVFTSDPILAPTGWGGIAVDYAIDTCHFRYCSISYARWQEGMYVGGSGLWVRHAAAIVEHCSFTFNTGYLGGGICVREGAYLAAADCEVVANGIGGCGGSFGGGITILGNCVAELRNCLVHANSAMDGGGIAISTSRVEFRGCTISSNTCTYWGGGMFINASPMKFDSCTFMQNQALEGAAICIDGDSTCTLQGCLIADNMAGAPNSYARGAIYSQTDKLDLTRCTFARNRSSSASSPAGISGTVHMLNSCIFAFHEGSSAVALQGATDVRHCCFFGNLFGDHGGAAPGMFGVLTRVNSQGDSCDMFGNLFLDPVFADTAQSLYTLLESSPCIDAGDPNLAPDPDNTVADIGAFYYPQPMAAPGPDVTVPAGVWLHPAWPNPFNPVTTLSVELAQAGPVSLKVYDLNGRLTATLAAGTLAAGTHRFVWNAGASASGSYFAVLASGSTRRVQKLLLLH